MHGFILTHLYFFLVHTILLQLFIMACRVQGSIFGSRSYGKNSENCNYLREKGPREVKMQASSVITRKAVELPELVVQRKPLILREREVEFEKSEADSEGKFGRFGGRFVPETLIACLNQLEAEFRKVLHDEVFQEELEVALRDYVGRETPLYYAERLTEFYKSVNGGKGPEIFLKREDLSHGGSHHMNNALAQAMMAKRLRRKCVVAATGTGQHGVATAAACAKLGLDCSVFMGTEDIEQQNSNVRLMTLLGAEVLTVKGRFKDAASEAIRYWVENLEERYHLTGTAVGPHPSPTMVRHFQSVIGRETRRQARERWGGKPDALVACVGTGSNALGLFHEFVADMDVRLVGVEAGGLGLESGAHASKLCGGEVGVYHGAMSYLLQDEEGQIKVPHSVAVGMQCPGVAPELSYLKETGRAEFYTATDQQALNACERLCKLEGIFASLEASHALAILDQLLPTFRNGSKVVVNCSGRGDKDEAILFKHKHFQDQKEEMPALH